MVFLLLPLNMKLPAGFSYDISLKLLSTSRLRYPRTTQVPKTYRFLPDQLRFVRFLVRSWALVNF